MLEMKSLTLNDKKYDCFVDSLARSQLEGAMVVAYASGEQIAVSDASNYKLLELHIYGKTIQDGTPTPEAPVDLVSLGNDGDITVTVAGERDSQSMTVMTPNGLPGIPVNAGGNYTDVNGQQWACDEIDFSRGLYIQRVNKITVTGSSTERWNMSTVQSVQGATRFDLLMPSKPRAGRIYCLCNAYVGSVTANAGAETCWCSNDSAATYLQFRICTAYASTVDELKAILQANPVEFIYQLSTPIETPLSEEELAAYAALHTYRNSTVVSNDVGAHMELEYVMDAKKYIDHMISTAYALVNATVE